MIRNYSQFNTKYRVFDKKKKIFIQSFRPLFIGTDSDLWIHVENSEERFDIRFLGSQLYYVMQSIGATDINGKEIFELDVVVIEFHTGMKKRYIVVEDDTYYLGLNPNGINSRHHGDAPAISAYQHTTEIIGTIFDKEHEELYNKVKEKLGL